MDLNPANLMLADVNWMESIYVLVIVAMSLLGALGKKLRGKPDDDESSDAPPPAAARPASKKFPTAKPRALRPGEQHYEGAAPAQRSASATPPTPRRAEMLAPRSLPPTPQPSFSPPSSPPPNAPAGQRRSNLARVMAQVDSARRRIVQPERRSRRPAPPQAPPQTEKKKPVAESEPTPFPAATATTEPTGSWRTVKGARMSADELRRAFILAEIFKPPVAFRDPEEISPVGAI